MKNLGYILVLATVLSACNNSPKRPVDEKISYDSANLMKNIPQKKTNPGSILIVPTHLKDTLTAKGNFILFLRPDSARFESYAKDENSGIYEVDSDFGFGISATDDSLKRIEKYKNIRFLVSTERYIIIQDCKTCPVTIDRDTIDYGFMLSGKGKQLSKISTMVHSGNYLQHVNEYFGLKKN